jgi:hypothetical protein
MAGVDTEAGRIESARWVRRGIVISFRDSVDAIFAATNEGKETGHDFAGFNRQTGAYGHDFTALCRTCRHEIVVGRDADGWAYVAPPRICASDAQ